jgi:hypothetical protein
LQVDTSIPLRIKKHKFISVAEDDNSPRHDDVVVEKDVNLVLPTLLPADFNIPVLSSKNLTIHRSQYNIGRLIVQKWLQSHGGLSLSKLHDMQSINLIILGPLSLDQTELDLHVWLTEIGHNAVSDPIISNSASLNKNAKRFFKRLQEEPDSLHVVIHDEAHYGIRNDGAINTFFQDVRKIMERVDYGRELAILLVSATIDVLTEAKSYDETKRVDWDSLFSDPYYAVPSYRSIKDLGYYIDPIIVSESTQDEASKLVVKDYCTAIDDLKRDIHSPSMAYAILKDIAFSNEPMMVVIRLSNAFESQSNSDRLVEALTNQLQNVFVIRSEREILPQLHEQDYEGPDIESSGELDNLKVIFILIDNCGMSQILPGTCKYYDVRCRYLAKEFSSLTTFVHDVGRNAGHKSEECLVLCGVNHQEKGKTINFDIEVMKYHR